jgi:uncharacterized protein (DUF2141 family)
MKLYFTFLCVVFSLLYANAQIPNGSTAPNWTMADINGVSHTLYNYLDGGYGVIIDFSATWCGPCWNYHNSHAMRDLYNENGPGGTDEARVFFIEGDANTNEACLYGPVGCVGGTQGNWVAGTPYPIINNHTQNGAYQIAYYPTIFGVCPTNTVQSRKIYLLGQRNKNGLYNFITDCVTLTYDVVTTHVDCYGDNDGVASITAKSGITPISYLWSTGSTSNTITGLAPGSYTCSITDGNGQMEISDPIIINGPTEPVSINILNITPEHCLGNNGSISIAANGGNGSYSYQWSNFASSKDIQQIVSGSYSVTVTDNLSCTGVLAGIQVERIEFPVAVGTADGFIDCVTPSVLIDGSGSTEGPGVAYFWSTLDGNIVSGENTLYPEVDQPGTYTLVVVDQIWGCQDNANVQVAGSKEQPEADAGPDLSLPCGGGQSTIQGSGDSGHPFQITWTTQGGNFVSGQNTLNPIVNAPGLYILTILDQSNGCVTVDQMAVQLSAEFDLASTKQNEQCLGANNGMASVSVVGGQGNINYLWSNGGTTQTIYDLAPGTYNVTVSDGSGCSNIASVTIEAGNQIQVSVDKGDESESGAKDGFIELTDLVNHSYNWSNGAQGNRIEGLSAGTYSVTVTDPQGCTRVLSIFVVNASCILVVGIEERNNATCFGLNNGHAIIQLTNDKGEAQITWSDGGSGMERNDLEAGVYTVLIIDDNNCPKTIEVVIEQPDPISMDVVRLPIFECANDNGELGIIEVEAFGGTGEFSYIWNSGHHGNIIEVPYGLYTVNVLDENGCNSIYSVRPEASDETPPIAIGKDGLRFSLDQQGSVIIPGIFLDNGSYDDCAIASFDVAQNPLICDDLGTQLVTLIVTDTNGNTDQVEVEVVIVDDLSPVFDCPKVIRKISNNPIVWFEDPAAADNCSVQILEQISGPVSGSEFPFGRTDVVFRAVDQSGNEAICRITIELVKPNRKVAYEEEKCFCPPVIGADPINPIQYEATNRSGNDDISNKIAVYPNPVNSVLWLDISLGEPATLSINMSDLTGKTILHQQRNVSNSERMELDLNAMPNGVYLMQITLDSCQYNKRIIIQH